MKSFSVRYVSTSSVEVLYFLKQCADVMTTEEERRTPKQVLSRRSMSLKKFTNLVVNDGSREARDFVEIFVISI